MAKPLKNRTRNAIAGYLFILPWIIGLVAFVAYPVIYSILLSLHTAKVTTSGIELDWAGLTYYTRALAQDTTFTTTIADTVLFMGCAVPVVLVFSLMIAILLNSKFRLRGFFRSVFFLPVIIMSGPAISELLTKYTVDFSETGAGIYEFLMTMPEFIQTPALFVLNNLVLILWFSGVQILIFLAGLQKISPEIYEAASIDGAGAWEKFWKITLPYIMPIAMVSAIYTVVEIANWTNNATNQKISSHLFEVGQPYSFSAAMSWIYFGVVAIVLLVVFLIFWLMGRRDNA